MKQSLIVLGSALSIGLAAPLAAQDASPAVETTSQDEFAALGDLFGALFGTPEPLTAEQEARLPAAQSVVLKVFPQGTYAKMMNETLAPIFEQSFAMLGVSPGLQLMELTGLDPSTLVEVDEKQLQEAVNLLDPKASERVAEMSRVTMDMMSDLVTQIEPSYRSGLMRAYAVRFSEAELRDLDAYFSTPVGRKYASESSLIYADPQVMSAMNELTPTMMQAMPAMFEDMQAVANKYPAGRTYSALSSSEQAQLASLLNVSSEQLAANEPVRQSGSDDANELEWVEQEGAS